MGWFESLRRGLSKTRNRFLGSLESLFGAYDEVDDDFFDELEEILIPADIGMETAVEITDRVREESRDRRLKKPAEVYEVLKEQIADMMRAEDPDIIEEGAMNVLLVIGVNGVGKTTTTEGADPGAVVYDAAQAAKARKADILLCDTAGRLHNKKNLMDELGKINRILDRELPGAHKEVLLVVDSTTGQNAMQQAKLFAETAPITGIILTKLDGTAKGGVVISIASQLGIPVKYIGVGEGIDDLQRFDPEEFAEALFTQGAEE